MGKTEISTMGSCSSRNIFYSQINKYYKNFFKINYSIEAVSLISLMSLPVEYDENLINSSHDYDNVCVREDLSKKFLEFVKEDKVDYIILDTLFDVFPGVIQYSENQFISDSDRLKNTDFYKTLTNTNPITPYTNFDEYYRLWVNACNEFFKFVETNCDKTKIILNCSRSVYKYISKDGRILMDKNFKILSDKYNPYRDIFDKYILENFDVDVLPFDFQTYAYENHVFGLHHTHFEPGFYSKKNNQLMEIIERNEKLGFYNVQNIKIRKFKRDNLIKEFNNHSKFNEEKCGKMKNDFMADLLKYGTARVDIKNSGNSDNFIEILGMGESTIKIDNPSWFNDNGGIGTVIESYDGFLDLEFKCINSGVLSIWLRGVDYRDKKGNRFPIYIDFTDFKLNDEKIFDGNVVTWHDEPYAFKKNVTDGEILKIHLEWLPFNYHTSYYNDANKIKNQNNHIKSLKEKLTLRETQIRSIPQLSATSLGKSTLNGKLVYRNWLGLRDSRSLMNDLDGFCESQWFTKYLNHKFPNEDYKIYLHGVFNPHDNITYPTEGKKVLYAIEDLNYRFIEMKMHFNKFALDYMDLTIGNEIVDNPNYLRFPYWLITQFPPDVTEEKIEEVVNSWNSSSYEKSRNVVSVSSHDYWGTRTIIANDIAPFVNIDFAGNWNRNTSELQEKFGNKKLDYLKLYKFNLCAENIITDAYVTEKIFDAISCDCIPLYMGGGSYLEPEVINPKAVIRWDATPHVTCDAEMERRGYYGYDAHERVKWVVDDGRNSDAIELFKNLLTDEKSYNEFKDQEKVLKSSSKFIINKFKLLEKHFERLIYD